MSRCRQCFGLLSSASSQSQVADFMIRSSWRLFGLRRSARRPAWQSTVILYVAMSTVTAIRVRSQDMSTECASYHVPSQRLCTTMTVSKGLDPTYSTRHGPRVRAFSQRRLSHAHRLKRCSARLPAQSWWQSLVYDTWSCRSTITGRSQARRSNFLEGNGRRLFGAPMLGVDGAIDARTHTYC